MTYNVSSGTLNPTIQYIHYAKGKRGQRGFPAPVTSHWIGLYDRWNISVLRRDLTVVRDGDVRVPCDMLFQADVAEAANGMVDARDV